MKDWKYFLLGVLVVAVVILIIAAFCGAFKFDNGPFDNSPKYSDLSDTEKENAKWAYEAQQAIDDYQ